jgi:hypothetical protein
MLADEARVLVSCPATGGIVRMYAAAGEQLRATAARARSSCCTDAGSSGATGAIDGSGGPSSRSPPPAQLWHVVEPPYVTFELPLGLGAATPSQRGVGPVTCFRYHDPYLVTGHACGAVLLWDLYTRRVLAHSPSDERGTMANAAVVRIAMDATGRVVVCDTAGRVRLLDVTLSQCAACLARSPATTVAPASSSASRCPSALPGAPTRMASSSPAPPPVARWHGVVMGQCCADGVVWVLSECAEPGAVALNAGQSRGSDTRYVAVEATPMMGNAGGNASFVGVPLIWELLWADDVGRCDARPPAASAARGGAGQWSYATPSVAACATGVSNTFGLRQYATRAESRVIRVFFGSFVASFVLPGQACSLAVGDAHCRDVLQRVATCSHAADPTAEALRHALQTQCVRPFAALSPVHAGTRIATHLSAACTWFGTGLVAATHPAHRRAALHALMRKKVATAAAAVDDGRGCGTASDAVTCMWAVGPCTAVHTAASPSRGATAAAGAACNRQLLPVAVDGGTYLNAGVPEAACGSWCASFDSRASGSAGAASVPVLARRYAAHAPLHALLLRAAAASARTRPAAAAVAVATSQFTAVTALAAESPLVSPAPALFAATTGGCVVAVRAKLCATHEACV